MLAEFSVTIADFGVNANSLATDTRLAAIMLARVGASERLKDQ